MPRKALNFTRSPSQLRAPSVRILWNVAIPLLPTPRNLLTRVPVLRVRSHLPGRGSLGRSSTTQLLSLPPCQHLHAIRESSPAHARISGPLGIHSIMPDYQSLDFSRRPTSSEAGSDICILDSSVQALTASKPCWVFSMTTFPVSCNIRCRTDAFKTTKKPSLQLNASGSVLGNFEALLYALVFCDLRGSPAGWQANPLKCWPRECQRLAFWPIRRSAGPSHSLPLSARLPASALLSVIGYALQDTSSTRHD